MLALVYQGVAFASLYWAAGRRQLWRWLAVIFLAVASIPLLYWIIFLALPTRYLIETDTAPEQTDWPLAGSKTLLSPLSKPALALGLRGG